MNARKEQRRKEAEARNEKWASLSYEEQLNQLDKLFGKDKGAAKQRAKIQLKMLNENSPEVTKSKPKRKRTRKKK